MNISRHGKFDGHLPYRLPTLYVCAECGGEIRCCCGASGGYNVTCRTDERHDGLKSRAQIEQEKSSQSVADTTEKATQLDALAKLSPEVNNYIQIQRQTLKKELFGED